MLDVVLQGAQASALTLREAGRRYGCTRMNSLLIGKHQKDNDCGPVAGLVSNPGAGQRLYPVPVAEPGRV